MRIPLIILFLYLNLLGFSQNNPHLDSLLAKLAVQKNDSIKVDLLIEVVSNKRYRQSDENFTQASQALKLSRDLNYKKGIAESYKLFGILYFSINNHYQSIQYFDSALVVFTELNDLKKTDIILTNIGTCYTYSGNYTKALSSHIEALKIAESINDTYAITLIYNNIAFLYNKQNNMEKAVEYYLKSINTKTKPNGQFMFAYLNIGNLFNEKHEYDSALFYYNKLLTSAKKENNIIFQSKAFESIASVYGATKNYRLGIDYYQKMLQIQKEIDDKRSISTALNGLGEIYFENNSYSNAEIYFSQAYSVSQQSGYLANMKKSSYFLALINDSNKKPKEALKYYKIFMDIKDSLINESNNKLIKEIESRYEFEKKEKEIALLNQEKIQQKSELKSSEYLRNLLGTASIFLIILVFVFYRNFRLKKKANELLLEINSSIEKQSEELKIANEALEKENILAQFETLKSQINPHFLFNSLNALSSLINVDKDKSQKFISEFSKVYRSTLDLKDKLLVGVREELQLVNSYMYLQKIRFGESLQIKIDLSQEAMDKQIPPFALQMLVENAVKHNSISSDAPLVLNLFVENNYLILQNNLQPRLEKIVSTKVGQKNLIERYLLIVDFEPVFYVKNNSYFAKIPLIA